MACNCNWGCPCSFDAPPTTGKCEASAATRLVEGKYGDIYLSGLKFVFVGAWPGAIHEKNGRGVVFLDPSAKGDKREALEAIATGKAGGPWGILMSTVTAGLEVKTAHIDYKFAGEDSYFRVGQDTQVEFESIQNPVTREVHHAFALLPTGLLTKREEFFSSKGMQVSTGGLNFSYPHRNALAFKATWAGP